MTCGCIPQVQSCLGCLVELATIADSFFGWCAADIFLTANTAAKVKTTADAAMTMDFMRISRKKLRTETEAHTGTRGADAPSNHGQFVEGIRL